MGNVILHKRRDTGVLLADNVDVCLGTQEFVHKAVVAVVRSVHKRGPPVLVAGVDCHLSYSV